MVVSFFGILVVIVVLFSFGVIGLVLLFILVLVEVDLVLEEKIVFIFDLVIFI